jgi:hypothetical protein
MPQPLVYHDGGPCLLFLHPRDRRPRVDESLTGDFLAKLLLIDWPGEAPGAKLIDRLGRKGDRGRSSAESETTVVFWPLSDNPELSEQKDGGR